MQQQSVHKIDYAKIHAAKLKLGSVMKEASASLKQLTAQGIATASPEDVSKALTETAVPAIEQTLEVINDVVDALPGGEEEGLGGEGGLGDEGNSGGLGDGGMGGEGEEKKPLEASFENSNKQPGYKSASARLQELETKTASLLAENIAMKKANLAKEYASTFPSNMRKAAEDDFLKEYEEDDDLEKMEAKVNTAKNVIKSYHDANMINKSRTSQTSAVSHTAKNGGMKTAKNDSKLDWRLRF